MVFSFRMNDKIKYFVHGFCFLNERQNKIRCSYKKQRKTSHVLFFIFAKNKTGEKGFEPLNIGSKFRGLTNLATLQKKKNTFGRQI